MKKKEFLKMIKNIPDDAEVMVYNIYEGEWTSNVMIGGCNEAVYIGYSVDNPTEVFSSDALN